MSIKINEGNKDISFAFLGGIQIFPNEGFAFPTPTPTPTPIPPKLYGENFTNGFKTAFGTCSNVNQRISAQVVSFNSQLLNNTYLVCQTGSTGLLVYSGAFFLNPTDIGATSINVSSSTYAITALQNVTRLNITISDNSNYNAAPDGTGWNTIGSYSDTTTRVIPVFPSVYQETQTISLSSPIQANRAYKIRWNYTRWV